MTFPDSSPPSASQYDADISFSASSAQSPKQGNPGSLLLQDLLRERKAHNERVANPSSNRGVAHETGLRNGKGSLKRRGSRHDDHTQGAGSRTSGLRRGGIPQQMGLREMEEVRTNVSIIVHLLISHSTSPRSKRRTSISSLSFSIDVRRQMSSKLNWPKWRTWRKLTKSFRMTLKRCRASTKTCYKNWRSGIPP